MALVDFYEKKPISVKEPSKKITLEIHIYEYSNDAKSILGSIANI